MPPLEVSLSPSNDDMYITFQDSKVVRGNRSLHNGSPRGPSKSKHPDRPNFAVYSRRDVIVGTNPLGDPHQDQRTRSAKKNGRGRTFAMELIEEYFSCMCVGNQPCDTTGSVVETSHFQNLGGVIQHPRVGNASTKKFTVYPIAKYPGRLNSPYLVEKRRKSLRNQLTFQPVHCE